MSEKNSMKAAKHKAIRQANIARDENRIPLMPAEQLKRLDFRLGKGVGAKKERARLLPLVAVIKTAKPQRKSA